MKVVSVKVNDDFEIEIEVEGETHTLGSLIAGELASMSEVEMAYYVQDHPLKEQIRIYLRTRPGFKASEVLEKAISNIASHLDEIEEAVRAALGLKG